jgi:hypothetical protein
VEKLEAMKLAAMLAAAYPNWKPSDETLELYATMLEPMPKDLGQDAAMAIIASPREFAPPVGVIIEAAAELALEDANRERLSAEEAWGIVWASIEGLGYYRGPGELGRNPAIQRAVRSMGWQQLCTGTNVEANRAHFMRIYTAIERKQFQETIRNLCAGELPQAIGQRALEMIDERREDED